MGEGLPPPLPSHSKLVLHSGARAAAKLAQRAASQCGYGLWNPNIAAEQAPPDQGSTPKLPPKHREQRLGGQLPGCSAQVAGA